MSDIGAYLASQLELAARRDAAARPARPAPGAASPDCSSRRQNSRPSARVPARTRQADGSGSEYAPSEEEEDDERVGAIPCERVRAENRRDLKRVVDDGNGGAYHDRTQRWKDTLRLVRTEGPIINEDDVQTADVRYSMTGNEDGDEYHQVKGGLLVPNYIWKQLYKFQRSGVKWLWELHQLESGGLLGDEMGLGKTVQLIAFLAGLSKTDAENRGGLGPSVIVTPATVIYQWVSHFHYWCPYLRVGVLHGTGSHSGNHHSLIRELHNAHGILLITYAGVVKYNSDIMARNWHYVVLDEGHKIRNPDTQVSKMVKKFKTPHKILITGSPMQNSLQELWSLFDFMSPGLLGTQSAFIEFFSIPITQGGYANASQLQEATALEIAKSLKNIITPYMIRRTKTEVQEHIKLPEKNEQVLFCSLSQEQRDLYLGYLLSGTVRSILDKDNRYGDPFRARILVAISTLRKICNHPDLYLYEAMDDVETITVNNFGHWKRSGKMTVVHSLLKIWHKQGHRALIFSQSRAMLCILEQFLIQHQYKYLKMDGTVSVGLRQNIIKTFNENSQYLVFLATTRVGGLGVNLTGADRVIIYDPDWNPATDSQAKERAWRIGQLRNVTIYRLLSAGTIEEKIYQRQVFKQLLGNKVLIDPNQKNLLKTSNLQGLFTLEEPNTDGDTETASIFSHTKVDVGQSNKDKLKNIHLSGGVSFSQKKMLEMRRRAREISKKITQSAASSSTSTFDTKVDPRERYKMQRKIMLNPPTFEKPEINIIDDEVTDVPFEAALSELDIITLHAKTDYLENLIKNTLQQEKTDSTSKEELLAEIDSSSTSLEIEESGQDKMEITNNIRNLATSREEENLNHHREELTLKKHSKKRKHSEKSDIEIEGLVAIKKVKKKKHRQDDKKNDDDYVLSKLFAKSGVQSALEHDKVVGLAEKEEIYRLKEEATRQAKHALRALKKSAKKMKPI